MVNLGLGQFNFYPPRIGDYVDVNGKLVRFDEYNEELKSSIVGIYIGDHPNGNKLVIPVDYDIYKGAKYQFCIEQPNFEIIPIEYNTTESEAKSRFNGQDRTRIILQSALDNDKSFSYFDAVNRCNIFSPGFHDGEWYMPAAGEMTILFNSKDIILQSLIRFDSRIKDYSYYTWTCTQESYTRVHQIRLVTGSVNGQNITNSYQAIIPYLQIENLI